MNKNDTIDLSSHNMNKSSSTNDNDGSGTKRPNGSTGRVVTLQQLYELFPPDAELGEKLPGPETLQKFYQALPPSDELRERLPDNPKTATEEEKNAMVEYINQTVQAIETLAVSGAFPGQSAEEMADCLWSEVEDRREARFAEKKPIACRMIESLGQIEKNSIEYREIRAGLVSNLHHGKVLFDNEERAKGLEDYAITAQDPGLALKGEENSSSRPAADGDDDQGLVLRPSTEQPELVEGRYKLAALLVEIIVANEKNTIEYRTARAMLVQAFTDEQLLVLHPGEVSFDSEERALAREDFEILMDTDRELEGESYFPASSPRMDEDENDSVAS